MVLRSALRRVTLVGAAALVGALAVSGPAHPTDAQIAAEAASAALRFGDLTPDAQYVVALPAGHNPAGAGYCAYHSDVVVNGKHVSFTNLLHVLDQGTGCGENAVN